MPESTLTLCQSRLYPLVRDLCMYRRKCAAEAPSAGCAGVQHPPPALSARQRYDLRKNKRIESNPKCRYVKN
jgi:hypothetical protein